MSSVLKSKHENPYAFIGDDDAGQPYHASGDVMPWEKSYGLTQQPSRDREVGSGLASFDLKEFAQALRAIPSGNPCANIKNDNDEPSKPSFSNPYRHIDNNSSDRQPYYVPGDRMSWEIAQAPVASDRAARGWALLFTAQLTPRRWARKRHTNEQIEVLARSVQLKLWGQRRGLFGDTDDPIKVLDPARVLELAGYTVRYHEGGLGHDMQDGVRVDVAGLIDPANKVVEISLLSSPMERLFTLAHELGHVMLGSIGTVVHRDRPLNGTRIARDANEREADKFAASFLMPSKLLRKAFLRRFLTECFELDDTTAFALRASWVDDVRKEFPALRALSCYLASTEHYNGGGFPSLASAFDVSPVAMAIRLEELGLIK
ncbi:MAG TPA: ImmA/IrrE family metallo-endopeptidase [Rhodanobacter sp.]|nr:ImmA/IrrE family metallo-endopeptidase [Rhodanobacter sp.]